MDVEVKDGMVCVTRRAVQKMGFEQRSFLGGFDDEAERDDRGWTKAYKTKQHRIDEETVLLCKRQRGAKKGALLVTQL